MQSVSSRIWTGVAVSISYDDNHYTTCTSFNIYIYNVNTHEDRVTEMLLWKLNASATRRLPFQLLLYPSVGEGATPFPGLFHFTLDTYLIMLSVKQGGIKYLFLVFGMTRPGSPLYSSYTSYIGFLCLVKSKQELWYHHIYSSANELSILPLQYIPARWHNN